MLCPNCESENRDGAKFCDECGFPLTGAIARAATDALPGADAPAFAAPEAGDAEEPAVPNPAATAALGGVAAAFAEEPGAGEGTAPETAEAPGNAEPAAGAAHDAEVTAAIKLDTAGIDQPADDYGERLVGADYVQPQASWRDGQTMQMPRIETDEAPKSTDFLASSTAGKQGRGKKVAAIVVAVVVVLAAAIAFGTYQAQLWGGIAVPDVTGMTESDATGVLEEHGFAVRSTQVKSDDTEGLVLIMDPAAGSRAAEGSEIVIHIATAREVPDVVGKTEDEAKAAMEEAGYENVTYDKERSDEEAGKVLSVSPEAGTRAKSTVAVMVKVAEPYIVPDVSGMSYDEAVAAIGEAGLAFDAYYVETENYPEGTLLGTDPEAGTQVKHDTVVYLQLARQRGAQLVNLTRDMLSPGSSVTVDGVSYEIESLDSVEYVGDDAVAFSLTGRPYTYFMGQYISLDSQGVSGHVYWTSDNGVADITS